MAANSARASATIPGLPLATSIRTSAATRASSCCPATAAAASASSRRPGPEWRSARAWRAARRSVPAMAHASASAAAYPVAARLEERAAGGAGAGAGAAAAAGASAGDEDEWGRAATARLRRAAGGAWACAWALDDGAFAEEEEWWLSGTAQWLWWWWGAGRGSGSAPWAWAWWCRGRERERERETAASIVLCWGRRGGEDSHTVILHATPRAVGPDDGTAARAREGEDGDDVVEEAGTHTPFQRAGRLDRTGDMDGFDGRRLLLSGGPRQAGTESRGLGLLPSRDTDRETTCWRPGTKPEGREDSPPERLG